MSQFHQRLVIDTAAGALFDADRRYLIMRPDVLMGMLHELPPAAQGRVLAAFEASAFRHGGKSVAAYAAHADAAGRAQLVRTMVETSAALGWGAWTIEQAGGAVELRVANSPFAAGHGPSAHPVCALIAGIFRSLAGALLGAPAEVHECGCAARDGGDCRFVARAAANPSIS